MYMNLEKENITYNDKKQTTGFPDPGMENTNWEENKETFWEVMEMF